MAEPPELLLEAPLAELALDAPPAELLLEPELEPQAATPSAAATVRATAVKRRVRTVFSLFIETQSLGPSSRARVTDL